MEGKDLIPVLKEWIGVLPTYPDAEKRGYDRLVRLLKETVGHLEREHGKWRRCKNPEHIECSVCGMWGNAKDMMFIDETIMMDNVVRYRYCPSCGARMDVV